MQILDNSRTKKTSKDLEANEYPEKMKLLATFTSLF